MAAKVRLDTLLAERGAYASRSAAGLAVRAGEVRLGNDGPVPTKPGTMVADDAELVIAEKPRFVSRGGEKIAKAATELGITVEGRVCLDIGASTGGFTDYLLQSGADLVIALDVGYGQLDGRLRLHPAVVELSRCNARELSAEDLPETPDFVTMDVSFISITKILPAIQRTIGVCETLAMVKPQFELERSLIGRGGVVRDAGMRKEALRRVVNAAEGLGWALSGAAFSGVPGPKGNRETFVHLVPAGAVGKPAEQIIAEVDA